MTNQCQHGQLARVCVTCEQAAEIATLQAEVAGLRAELLKSLADNAPLRERAMVLEDALLRVARMAEALKKDCGMDPESPRSTCTNSLT